VHAPSESSGLSSASTPEMALPGTLTSLLCARKNSRGTASASAEAGRLSDSSSCCSLER
jgi:hypothetical protein